MTAHGAFVGLSDAYNHHRVNHSAGEYVRHFCLHTNGIESVWALFKRQIVGTHHFLSPKHMNAYLGETTRRFNLREMGEGSRVNALLAQTAGRLTYRGAMAKVAVTVGQIGIKKGKNEGRNYFLPSLCMASKSFLARSRINLSLAECPLPVIQSFIAFSMSTCRLGVRFPA